MSAVWMQQSEKVSTDSMTQGASVARVYTAAGCHHLLHSHVWGVTSHGQHQSMYIIIPVFEMFVPYPDFALHGIMRDNGRCRCTFSCIYLMYFVSLSTSSYPRRIATTPCHKGLLTKREDVPLFFNGQLGGWILGHLTILKELTPTNWIYWQGSERLNQEAHQHCHSTDQIQPFSWLLPFTNAKERIQMPANICINLSMRFLTIY